MPNRNPDEAFEEDRPRPQRPRSEDFEDRPRRRRPPNPDDDDPDRRPRREDSDDPRRPYEDDGDALSSIIPYKNGQALAAYYVGVFSLIPCIGFVLAIVAIVLGVLGLKYVKRNPSAKGTGHAITGIVLGSLVLTAHIAIAVFAIAGGLLARR